MSLKPWWEIARPHKDIRDGKLDEAVFAADLGDVVAGRGPIDYRDPETFFRKTYLTKGLENLLSVVISRLSGLGGDGVIQLQTPFGGGKTHALIALYHVAKNRGKISHLEVIKKILRENKLKEIPETKVAVFVGTYADPVKGKTIWGELAEQLGFYDLIKAHDEKKVSPGKERMREILKQSQPVLLLVDELLEYVVKASRVEEVEKIPKGQILAFLQELTEVVASLEKCSLVLTLPSSVLERYDESAEQALTQLQKVSGRVEAIYTPVEGEEVYEIIRKRLFEDLGDTAYHSIVADEYFNLYRKLGEDIPGEAREVKYREKLKQAYPFHPEVIDILYERWGAIPTFQRTRGVLRLLAEIVADLYKREHISPLIQPAHINLASASIRREFIKHIGNEYESVIASDISGEAAKAARIDREMGSEYARYKVASGLATAIFFYSFSGGLKKGITLPRLRLAFLRNGIPHAIVGDAVRRLEEELWYLHTDRSLYYFLNQPNLNRVIIDKEEIIGDEEVEKEILRRINRISGTALEVYLYPKASSDIPDTKKIKLAILSPNYPFQAPATRAFVEELFTKYSTGFRTYKNTLLFLMIDSNEYEGIRKSVRRYLALNLINEDRELAKTLSEENKKFLENKIKELEISIPFKTLSAYRYLAKGSKEGINYLDMGIPTLGERQPITSRVKEYLKDQEKLLDKISPKSLLDLAFGKEEEKKSIKELWEAFLKYPELPLLASEDVLKNAIVEGVKHKNLGALIGECTYIGEDISKSSISDDAVVMRRDLAEKLKQKVEVITEKPPSPVAEEKPTPVVKVGKVRKIKIRAKVPWDKLSSIMSGILRPLHQEGATTVLEVEVCAESEVGISKDTLELKIKETLKQIGAEIIEMREE
jgi:exonuclease VII small subunit